MKLKINQFMQAIPIQVPDNHQFTLQVHPANRFIPQMQLPINDAIQIKAAEYWLRLGEADEALRELEKLSETWNSPAAIKVRVAAIGMLEVTV
jgi:hypothetical protein